MTEEKVSRGTGIRYHLSTKLQAVTDYVQGMRKKDILERVGCRRNVLDLWIKKYGDEVRKNLAAAAEPAAEPVAEAVAEPVAEAVALADLVRLPNGSLDLTEEQRVWLVMFCRLKGVTFVSRESRINRSTLDRWNRTLRLTRATQKSLATAVLPMEVKDYIYVLREQLHKLQCQMYEINRQSEATKRAIEVLETANVRSNNTE